MAGHNNDGLAGISVEQVALSKHIAVGLQAPNSFPCMRIDENGKSLPVMKVAENGGTQVKTSAGYNCSCADTSWLSRCGNYSVKAGNTISFSCGSGGITATTSGPLKIHNRYTDFISTHGYAINTRLFTASAVKRMQFAGGRCDFVFDSTYFNSNVNFLKNVHVNGGMYVNGEFICRHMSAQAQINLTSQGPECEGFINPDQKFKFLGSQNATIGLPKLIEGLPSIDIDTSGITQSPIGTIYLAGIPNTSGIVALPIYGIDSLSVNLKFEKDLLSLPNIQIQSNAFLDGIAGGEVTPDIKMPAHVHSYITPACHFLKDTSSIFEEAKKLTESKTPFAAKPMYPNGQESFEMFMEQVKEMVEKQAKDWLKEWFKKYNPFSTGS